MILITYYFRPGCGLCKETEPALEACAREYGATITRVNIDLRGAVVTLLFHDRIRE